MERYLEIKNYRNIGVDGKKQKLLLNTSIDKGEIGNLVIVTGQNNSGKSNFLDALITMDVDTENLSESDITDFDINNPNPELSLVIRSKDLSLKLNKSLNENNNSESSYYYSDKVKSRENIISSEAKEFVKNICKLYIENVENYYSSNYHNKIPSKSYETIQKNASGEFEIDCVAINFAHETNQSIFGDYYFCEKFDQKYNEDLKNKFLNEINCNNQVGNIQLWESRNNLRISPKITRFKSSKFNKEDLLCRPNQISNSHFFKLLFDAIDYDANNLVSCYEKVRREKSTGFLKLEQSKINDKLEKVSKQFNDLFFLEKNKYLFEIDLDADHICLNLFINKDTTLIIDKQSSGFKWFFDFYFSILAKKDLQRGDIIVMDEPATTLHMRGIQELRSFIKKYAKKSELTFVISTHLPFFLDLHHLEEVRVVWRDGNNAVMENKFHAIEDKEIDALKPIKNALTVGRHVLYDQNKINTIFVEGMNEYCCLSAFAILFDYKNFVFLPIQGVKNGKKENIINTLIEIENLPHVLVDADEAGIDFQKNASKCNSEKKTIIVVQNLSEIDESWKTIEDLFDENDKLNVKNFNNWVNLKSKIINDKISDKTKCNFQKLFDHLV